MGRAKICSYPTVDTGRRLYVIDGLGEDQRRARRHMVLEVNIT